MNRYLVAISYLHDEPEVRVLDDTSLVMFLTENIKRLHCEGDGYDIVSIGQDLGDGKLRPLTLRLVDRYCDQDADLHWSYELTSAGHTDLGDDPELTEMTFTVCIDGRA